MLDQLELVALGHDGADGAADIAAHADLGGYRAQQQLLLGDAALKRVVPVAVAVVDHAGELDVVHGEDHARA